MNDINCIICFEELPDSKLVCCNKFIHEKCLREWWSKSELSNCPHCRQKANLADNIIIVENSYFGKDITNISIELTADRIREINENSNNSIPNNMFINENNFNKPTLMTLVLILFFIFFIIGIVILVSVF